MDRTVLTYQCDMDTGAGVNVRLVCVSMFWQNFWGYTRLVFQVAVASNVRMSILMFRCQFNIKIIA